MQVVIPRLAQTGLNSPTELPNLAAWYNARDTASMTIDGSDRVSLWQDRSGRSDEPALVLQGGSGNSASTPDSAAISITGDLDIALDVLATDWTPASAQVLIGKGTSVVPANLEYALQVNTDGTLTAFWSTGASTLSATSTVAVGATDLSRRAVRAVLDVDDGGDHTVTFYTATTFGLWIQLGAAVTGSGTTSIQDSTNALAIGSFTGGASGLFLGNVYRAQVRNGIDGPIVFDADFTKQPKGTTSFTEDSVNAATVTVNQSGDLPARITGERDLYQATVTKMPVYLPYTGTNYGWLGGVNGNGFTTPNSAGITLTGDLSFVCRVTLDSVAPSGFYVFGSQQPSSGQFNWEFYLGNLASGTLRYNYSENGSSATVLTASASLASAGVAANTEVFLGVYHDVDNGAGGNDVKFYWSADGTTWTQIGTTRTTAGTVTRHASTGQVAVGAAALSTLTNPLAGRMIRATLSSGNAFAGSGTVVADFNPALYTNGTTFTAATGEVWTLNGGATIVDKTKLYFDGSNDFLKAPPFALSQPTTVYFVGEQVTWTAGRRIIDGNAVNTLGLLQEGATPSVVLRSASAAASNTGWALSNRACIVALFNAAQSLIRVNLSSATTGNPGTNNAGGLIVGADGNATANFANIAVSEIVIFAAAHDTATQDRVIRALARQGSISV
jgi:hypothetical protein